MRPSVPHTPLRQAGRALLILALTAGALAGLGCGASRIAKLSGRELAEAQTFPYYRVYWAGPLFEAHPLTAADGLRGYIEKIGDSVYYGDCVKSKGIFGGGSCVLPLQVTTVIYRLHTNTALGPQYNRLIRGVPATVYDEGRSVEIYTGRVAVDVFSDTFAHALVAIGRLRPINAPGSASGPLPEPVYCPGLSGVLNLPLARVIDHLPGHACQRAAAALARQSELKS